MLRCIFFDRQSFALWPHLIAVVLIAGMAASAGDSRAAELALNTREPIRILHVMSYHATWSWNRDQFNAFQESLGDLNVEYRVYEMDTKRRSDPSWKEEAGAQARALIDSWQPDLVYANDDNAQEYVVRPYARNDVPFVFSGVNADPSRYGFDRRSNVTGILEQEHILQTLHLIREIAPNVRRIAVLMDDDPTWIGVSARLRAAVADLPDLEVVSWDTLRTFEEYRQKVEAYQETVDALAVLGVFALKDEQGNNTPFEEVLRWTAANSRLPDFSFWGSRVELGTLAAVAVSAQAQGRAAGELAREILVEGGSPDNIPMRPTLKGRPVISLARARQLGLDIESSTLLNSQVLTKYAWE